MQWAILLADNVHVLHRDLLPDTTRVMLLMCYRHILRWCIEPQVCDRYTQANQLVHGLRLSVFTED